MRNHYHLAVETPQPNLLDGLTQGPTPSDRPLSYDMAALLGNAFTSPIADRHKLDGLIDCKITRSSVGLSDLITTISPNQIAPDVQCLAKGWIAGASKGHAGFWRILCI
jgi:hypothetical protein